VQISEFEAFFRSVHPRLLRYARRAVDAATAQELAAQALQSLWTKDLPAATDEVQERQLQSLAFRILDGLLLNEVRSRRRQLRLMGAVLDDELTRCQEVRDVADLSALDGLSDSTSSALGALSDPDRAVVALLVDGFRVHEIATILGATPGAISMRLSRAKHTLRDHLAGEADDDQQP